MQRMGQFYSGVARGLRTGLIAFKQPWQKARERILSGQAGIVLTSGCLTGNIYQVEVHVKGQNLKVFSGNAPRATNKMTQQTRLIKDRACELETARKEDLKRL